MSSTSGLQSRLKELSAALGHIHPLVSRLRNFTTAVGQGDEARLELGAEIHSLLKEAEEQLELLKVEVEALEAGSDSRRKTQDNEKELERERVLALAGRLTDDLKRTRGDFRNAQLQAKRNAEVARRKERELLFSRAQSAERHKQSNEKLTQDEVTVNASNDVTAALRRTHQLMSAELSRSQFAHETLEQSTAAISSLSESYTDLDSLLSSSRNLIGSLLRSQKSDTWYLETAFYVLVGTITWLLFRRILYGPLWWLVWLPVRLVFNFMFTILGAVGITSKAVQASPSAVVGNTPTQQTQILYATAQASVESAGGDAIWDQPQATEEPDSDRIIDKIGEMVEESETQEEIAEEGSEEPEAIADEQSESQEESAEQEETNIKDISPEERQRQADLPRNPKKRMYEATEVLENRKDEL